jgi:hypothetical protein
MADTPLDRVPGWSPEHVARMRDAWIMTAEQVIALGSTDGGLRSMSEQLRVPVSEVERLVAGARAELSHETRAELETPVDTSQYGLGAARPARQPRDR